tara:strand:- start:172 stop:675 length:504 start_codon:yes stop_codon:yes gene_type:complete
MFSLYQRHHKPLYSKLVDFSRNIFFYKQILLKDNFETRINLIFLHFSLILIIFKKKKKDFPQEIFDNIFLNIEYHIREIGYGDVTVNKKMKTLTRIFYDILLKINKSKSEGFETNNEILKAYFDLTGPNTSILIDNLSNYFNNFYNFCFEIKTDNMLKGKINFNYKI